ncbi:MAG: hypothetical protein AAGI10_04595 [Pseudomonadota bacterium]
MLRYPLSTDWPFYALLLAYAYLIVRMTSGLWFGDGINIFASYSDTTDPAQFIVDANKVYWAKTCFLFGLLLMMALNVDFRAAAGIGAFYWAVFLMLMFGATPTLAGSVVLGVLTFGLQIYRGEFFS